MNGHYDPMTGMFIPEEGYDPITGQPVTEDQQFKKPETISEARYEDATEEVSKDEITPEVSKDEITEETGRQKEQVLMTEIDMQGNEEQDQTLEVRYDPMTGKPILVRKQDEASSSNAEMNYDPMTGKPIKKNDADKSAKKKIYALIGAALVLGLITFVQLFQSGVIFGKTGRIAAALKNTVQLDHFGEAVNVCDQMMDGNFGATISYETKWLDTAIQIYSDTSKRHQYLSSKATISGVNFEAKAALTKKELQLQLPFLSDNLYIYNYKDQKDGYLVDYAKENNVNLEAIDHLLAKMNQSNSYRQLLCSFGQATKKTAKQWEIKDAHKEICSVNGRNHSCQGYEMVIGEDEVMDLIDAYEEAVNDYSQDTWSDLEAIVEDEIGDYGDVFDRLRDEFDGMPDFNFHLYFYKNQIAKIVIDSKVNDNAKIMLEFLGGKVPTQNVRLTAKNEYDKYVFEKETKIFGQSEQTEYLYNGNTVVSVKYDYKFGDFTVTSGAFSDHSFRISGNLLKETNRTNLVIDRVQSENENVDFKMSLLVEQTPKIPELQGERIDVGNMSEDELTTECEKLKEDFERILRGDAVNFIW